MPAGQRGLFVEAFHVGLIAIADPYRRLALPQVFEPAALIHDPVHT